MNVGVCVSDWGGAAVFGDGKNLTQSADVANSGFEWIRWPTDLTMSHLETYWLTPYPQMKACLCFPGDTDGDYNAGGVQALDPDAWAAWALNIWTTNTLTVDRVPAIEILNEPDTAFWGSTPNTQANAEAYGALVKAAAIAFRGALGADCPKILAYTFGTNRVANPTAVTSWWNWLTAAHADIGSYYDAVVIHPYGAGTPYGKTVGATGNRDFVATAHATTGKNVWITEYGWVDGREPPNATADASWAYQFTDAEIASNITAFNDWCRTTGYVDSTFLYEYLDEPDPAFWGLCYGNNPAGENYVHKTAPFIALQLAIPDPPAPPAPPVAVGDNLIGGRAVRLLDYLINADA